MRRSAVLAVPVLIVLWAGGCREPDAPGAPGQGGTRMLVTSDPAGATIFVDQRSTGLVTPDTVAGMGGLHLLRLVLEAAGTVYSFSTQVAVPRTDELQHLHAPLTVQCGQAQLSACYAQLHRYHTAAGLRFATHDLGGLFMRHGSGQGLFWPAALMNTYVSGGMPVIAGRVGGSAVSLGMYDHHYFAGRPAPVAWTENDVFRLRQEAWIVPPATLRGRATIRGISVHQEVVAAEDVQGVALIRLRFRNISHEESFQVLDSFLGAAGATFTDTWIGMLLDADIGQSNDDWYTYDPALDMVYAYDARFQEPAFSGNSAAAPALVGLRALQAPAGTRVILNGWMSGSQTSADWRAGQPQEFVGLEILSGTRSFEPTHPDPRIGHLAPSLGDARLAITAGPLTLAPGQEAEIVLALAVAPPAPGTFETGALIAPGNPFDQQRAIHRVAAALRERMLAAEALLQY